LAREWVFIVEAPGHSTLNGAALARSACHIAGKDRVVVALPPPACSLDLRLLLLEGESLEDEERACCGTFVAISQLQSMARSVNGPV
jgi:hypothetical protein